MSKRAVVVVDLQNEYLPSGKLPLVGIEQALDNAARVISAARGKGDLVVHVRHEFPQPGLPFFVPGTDGVQIHPTVAPQEGEQVIVKNRPNSFLGTGLEAALDARGVEEVTIVGAMSHMCVDSTTRAAAELGYKTTVVEDACATRDLEFRGQIVPAALVHASLMSALAFAFGAVVTTEEYVNA